MTWKRGDVGYLNDAGRRSQTDSNLRTVYPSAKSKWDMGSDSCNNPNMRQYRMEFGAGERRLIQSAELEVRRSSNASRV